MSCLQRRDRTRHAACGGMARYAGLAVRIWRRRAPALAHQLLAAPAVTTNAADHGLFSTQLGTTGPRVVFLHGLFGQGKNWTTIAKGLSDSARVTLVDLPNHGRSGWTDHFSYPEMAGQVAELLQTEGGNDQWAVIGHSMGGKVAMTLALLKSELVERLCVVDVSPVPSQEIHEFQRFIHGMQSIDLKTLPDRKQADAELSAYVSDPTIRSFLLQNLRQEHSSAGKAWRWQMNLELLDENLSVMGGWPDLGAQPYKGPVLWLAGAKSGYVRAEYSHIMRAHFPRVQLVKIKNAGHWLHSEQPAAFLATIRRFLGLDGDVAGHD